MHYYTRNIGDYRRDTMHLSLLEHGIYNQLLDWYYLDEQPIVNNNQTLFRRLSARTEEEQNAVLTVLSEMFSETTKGWVHGRVDRELAQYKARAAQARTAGKLGGRPSKKGAVPDENRDGFSENRDGSYRKPKAKPTNNHKPITNNQEEQHQERIASPNKARRLPDDWAPSDQDRQFASTLGVDSHEQANRFRDYWHARSGAGAAKLSWSCTWRNWIRRAADENAKSRRGATYPLSAVERVQANIDRAERERAERSREIEAVEFRVVG
ncbi:MAG: YdaU family protein [Porticoccaceae bacterium]